MDTLRIEIEDEIGIVSLHRPDKLNAINTQMLSDLDSVLEAWMSKDLRAVIVTGTGKAFAAGADISQMSGFTAIEAQYFAAQGQRSLRRLELFKCPTIAAVNGYALGGGCELAMCCDLILAGERAVFGQPEVKLGVIPGFGGSQRLVRRVGRQRALELMMTGRNVKADEAVEIGLALRKTEDVLVEAKKLALKIASNGPIAVRLVKQLVDNTDRMDLESGLASEASSFGLCFSTQDQKAGMNAFLQGTKASFIGK